MGHRRNDRPDVPAGRGVRARPLMDALLLRPAPSISSPYFPVHKERLDISAFIRHVPDYPHPGILFYDITPLLASPEAFGSVTDQMADAARPLRPTVIVAPEARGFLLAAPLAQRLGISLVPIRKPGKLPCAVFSASYDLEYGSNTLCMHKDALHAGDRALIVDDVLATGGTAEAMLHLIRQSGADVAGCCMLMELDALKGRRLLEGIPLSVLLHV